MIFGLINSTDVPETFEPAQTHDNHLFSARTIEFAKQRMRHCSRSHPTCSSSASLPLWVIHITGNGLAAKLLPGVGRVEPYVTLSYKWGQVTRYTMTTANRSSLQHEIPLDQLPKTFLDAIELTHKLGYKYLWIDALCITQDDSRELGEQIAAMQNVYSGSDLTLFAADGFDANEGLNRTRDATVNFPIKVTIQAELPRLSTTVSKSLWIVNARGWLLNYHDPPLFERGWVLQEQLLSRRGLVFKREYVSWRCLHDNVSEILPFDCKVSLEEDADGIERDLRDCDGLAHSRNWFWAESTDVRYKADFPLEPYYKAIELYMRRALTFKSDALPAIAGLLAMTEQRTGSKFYHGTCLQDTRGFLWHCESRIGLIGSGIPPSWAWTSCFGQRGTFFYVRSFDYTWQVAEHHDTRDRGGLEVISWTQWGTLESNRFIPQTGGGDQRHNVFVDADQDPSERRVLCIFVAINTDWNHALIAEPCHGEENTFVRIGISPRWKRRTVFDVVEAVERQGAVMNSQREGSNPQRPIQYLV